MVLLLLSACSDTGLNKDAPEETTPTEDPGMCPAYSGFHHAGQTWSWSYVSGTRSITSLTTLDSMEEGTVKLHTESSATDTDYTGQTNTHEVWRCDEAGATLLEEVLDTHQEQGGAYPYTYEDTVSVTYLPTGWLRLPADMDSGSSWEVAFTLLQRSTQFGEYEVDWSGSYFVENEEEIETPAGTFLTLELNGSGAMADGYGSTWSVHEYRDAEAGLVLDDTAAQLEAWTR